METDNLKSQLPHTINREFIGQRDLSYWLWSEHLVDGALFQPEVLVVEAELADA